MDFRREAEFQELDRRYTDLVRQRDAGRISEQDFESQRQQLTALDDEGRWWSKSPDGGHWLYHDGTAWIRGTPPSHQEATPEPMAGRPQQQQAPAAGGRKRRAWPWVAALIVVVGIGALAWSFSGQGIPGLGGSGFGGSGFDAVFIHRATADNISAENTYIDNESINGNHDAILYVTQHWNPDQKNPNQGVYNKSPIGVWYDPNQKRWAILNENRADMPEGAAFNVAVVESPQN